MRSCREGDSGGLPNSVMSAPPEKPRPAPIMTIALTAGSAAAAFSASIACERSACESAFTGGESSVTTAISPSRDAWTTVLPSTISPVPILRIVPVR